MNVTFAGIDVASVTGRVRRYQVYSEAINGRMQVRNVGGKRLEWTLTFPPMTRSEFKPVWDVIESLDGMQRTTVVALPNPSNPTVLSNYTVRVYGEVQEYEMRSDNLVEYELDLVQAL